MRRAIELALENAERGRGGPFAALVVRDEEIIAEGTNLVTSANDPTAHAEVVAIRRACGALGTFRLSGCDLYATCEPCPMCLGAIYWARPRCLYFGATAEDAAAAGFDDSFIFDQLRLPPADRRIPARQIMRQEALTAFAAWLSNPDRVAY
jgi:tRNA(Arg) A34 adenosine deaminase TadA